jgi:hypothetical protein
MNGIGMLIAWDADGNVVGTLDYLVMHDDEGNLLGLVDFYGIEQAGIPYTRIYHNDGATGSGWWPEWLGTRAQDFRVEKKNGKIIALVHGKSKLRRDRATIERAIADRIEKAPRDAEGRYENVDLRDLVGGPNRPLALTDRGRTLGRGKLQRAAPPNVPLIRRDLTRDDEAARSSPQGRDVPLPDLDRHVEVDAGRAERRGARP